MRSPGMITGMPGGYGVICSAHMRPTALSASTVSLDAKKASRGSMVGSSSSSGALGVNHHVRAGGHQHVGTGRQLIGVNQVALLVEDRSLLEAGAHLVHADHAHVRAGVHGPCRQVLVEGQVGAPGLVDDQRLTSPVADIGD